MTNIILYIVSFVVALLAISALPAIRYSSENNQIIEKYNKYHYLIIFAVNIIWITIFDIDKMPVLMGGVLGIVLGFVDRLFQHKN